MTQNKNSNDNMDATLDEELAAEIKAGLLGEKADTEESECHENLPEVEENAEPTLEEQLASTKDQLLRALAEAENTRKRAIREREDATQYAITNFARELLSVADNMHRALESLNAVENEELKPLIEGVKMTEKELMQVFSKFKIKKTEALDKPFDHNFHQAMVEIPSEEHEPGTVIQEMQAGYTLSDRLLRPSMVAVSKK